MAAVFIASLVVGIAMPVLPLHVHQGLGLSTFLVSLVAGSQFTAAILSRVRAGRRADARGPKHTVIAGLAIAAGSRLLYLVSLSLITRPSISVTILLLGRALLGVGESFIIAGGQSWALAILTAQNTSKALAWIGAFAVGAPIGSALYARYGFSAVALATMLLPLATLLCIVPLRGAPSAARARRPHEGHGGGLGSGPGSRAKQHRIRRDHRLQRGALCFPRMGGVACLHALRANVHPDAPSSRPSRRSFAAAKVALICVLVEAAGLALIWLAPWLLLALTGAALTGFGYSLVYPSLGVEAVRLAPAQSRGLAMGAYTAFLDVALGFGTPALGLLADHAGLVAVFGGSMRAALGAAGTAAVLLSKACAPRSGGALACP
jgi:MFS family permease